MKWKIMFSLMFLLLLTAACTADRRYVADCYDPEYSSEVHSFDIDNQPSIVGAKGYAQGRCELYFISKDVVVEVTKVQ